jgi:hypothetical protein
VNARLAQHGTETAVGGAQATIIVQQTAIAATQTAFLTLPPPPATPAPTELPTGAPGAAVSCPFYVYLDYGSTLNHYTPAGWMGDTDDIKFDDNYQLDLEHPNAIQIVYTPTGDLGWAGIYWWNPPESNWDEVDGGFDLSCATRLTFQAKGKKGNEVGIFKVGGLKGAVQDSLLPPVSSGPITLTEQWAEYSIPLDAQNLKHIIGGFVWVTNKELSPKGATIYLDEIRFE